MVVNFCERWSRILGVPPGARYTRWKLFMESALEVMEASMAEYGGSTSWKLFQWKLPRLPCVGQVSIQVVGSTSVSMAASKQTSTTVSRFNDIFQLLNFSMEAVGIVWKSWTFLPHLLPTLGVRPQAPLNSSIAFKTWKVSPKIGNCAT